MLKYHCRILFTTCSRYENHISLEARELNSDALLELVVKVFPEADKKQEKIKEMIALLYGRTFAVELPAGLLASGKVYSGERNACIDSLNSFLLLIIDDLGVERNSEFAREQVFNIIDSRYRSKLPMIVTTNLTVDELKNPADPAQAAHPGCKGEASAGLWEAVQCDYHDGSPAECGSSALGGRKKAGTASTKGTCQTSVGTLEKAAQSGL